MTVHTNISPWMPAALIVLIIAWGGDATAASADSTTAINTAPSAPIDLSIPGLFTAIGPVRWGILPLTVMLVSISIAGLIFLTMPLSRRYLLASALTSLKEWNTVLSTLLTILGPIGTYIGMIGALLAMHQVAIAVDTAVRLSAQAAFFQKAAEMFISSLAGIGLGMSLGLANNLILYHVLPDHEYPIEGDGMIASTLNILAGWMQKPGMSRPIRNIQRNISNLSAKVMPKEVVPHEDTSPGMDRTHHDRPAGVSGGGDLVSVRIHGSGQGSQKPSDRSADDPAAAATDSVSGKHRQGAQTVRQ